MRVLKNEKQMAKFSYDFARDGGEIGDIPLKALISELEGDMVVTDIIVRAVTPLASAGSATVTFGDGTTADRFLANQFANLDAAGDIVRDGTLAEILDEGAELNMSVGVAALTAGELEVYVEFYSK